MNVHFFLSKLGAEGVPSIYPRSPIVVEMMDGSVFAGQIEEHPIDHLPPAWINPQHQKLGDYSFYLRTTYGHRWTSFLRERKLPQNPTKPHLPLHIYIQTRRGSQISVKNLSLVDNRHRLDPSKELVYISMPDGSVYFGELD